MSPEPVAVFVGEVYAPPPRYPAARRQHDYEPIWRELRNHRGRWCLFRATAPGAARLIAVAAASLEAQKVSAVVRGEDIYLRWERWSASARA